MAYAKIENPKYKTGDQVVVVGREHCHNTAFTCAAEMDLNLWVNYGMPEEGDVGVVVAGRMIGAREAYGVLIDGQHYIINTSGLEKLNQNSLESIVAQIEAEQRALDEQRENLNNAQKALDERAAVVRAKLETLLSRITPVEPQPEMIPLKEAITRGLVAEGGFVVFTNPNNKSDYTTVGEKYEIVKVELCDDDQPVRILDDEGGGLWPSIEVYNNDLKFVSK